MGQLKSQLLFGCACFTSASPIILYFFPEVFQTYTSLISRTILQHVISGMDINTVILQARSQEKRLAPSIRDQFIFAFSFQKTKKKTFEIHAESRGLKTIVSAFFFFFWPGRTVREHEL